MDQGQEGGPEEVRSLRSLARGVVTGAGLHTGELPAALQREVAALRRAVLPGSYRVQGVLTRVQRCDRGLLSPASYRDWMAAVMKLRENLSFDYRQKNIRIFQSSPGGAWGVWLDGLGSKEVSFRRRFHEPESGGALLVTEEAWPGGEVARLGITLGPGGGLELTVVAELGVEDRDYTMLVTYACRTSKGQNLQLSLSRYTLENLKNMTQN
jgi:hypothetical protein